MTAHFLKKHGLVFFNMKLQLIIRFKTFDNCYALLSPQAPGV